MVRGCQEPDGFPDYPFREPMRFYHLVFFGFVMSTWVGYVSSFCEVQKSVKGAT